MQSIHPTKLILGLIGIPVAAASAWLCAAVAKYGVHLDPAGVTALATAGAAGAIGLIAKLIHDVEKTHPSLERDVQTFEKAAADQNLTAELSAGAWPPPPAPGPGPAPLRPLAPTS